MDIKSVCDKKGGTQNNLYEWISNDLPERLIGWFYGV